MTTSPFISEFHQWLFAAPASRASARTIVLHGDDSSLCKRLVEEITQYLNEYDDSGEGCWLPATPELVEKIARDPHLRLLLGLDENGFSATADPQSEIRKTLVAIGQRGHVVIGSPGGASEDLDPANTFHAGVGNPKKLPETCHLILNPDLMDQKCIDHIVGDVFLDWLNCGIHRNSPIQNIR